MAAANPTVNVTGDHCNPVVAVTARDVPLSQVLDELAQELSFRATVAAPADRNVTVALAGSARDVIAALTRHHNVMFVEQHDPACGELRRPVRLTVLEGRPPVEGTYVVEALDVAPDPELTVRAPRLTRLAPARDDGKDEPRRRRNRD